MIDKSKSKMGVSPVNFSILQSTDSATDVAQETQTSPEETQVAKKVAKAIPITKAPAAKGRDVGKKSAHAPEKSRSGAPKSKENTQEDPFGYDIGPVWPLVSYEKPFLIQTPENQGRAAAALSVRIPLDLNLTVERHCAKLGIKNLSEWVREAMARQLALEQQHLSKK